MRMPPVGPEAAAHGLALKQVGENVLMIEDAVTRVNRARATIQRGPGRVRRAPPERRLGRAGQGQSRRCGSPPDSIGRAYRESDPRPAVTCC